MGPVVFEWFHIDNLIIAFAENVSQIFHHVCNDARLSLVCNSVELRARLNLNDAACLAVSNCIMYTFHCLMV